MVVLRLRGTSDSEEVLRKLKKMHKFTKELIECIDEDYDDEEDDDDNEDFAYRHNSMIRERRGMGLRSRYRRSM